ncbi:amino acid ABC transporter permease [Alsobacter metallidurans]|uniref:Amino acid ABC transporter permease n=1 Tax=Alsobacter metallidurans TaxID=340221 RepID=A0A917I629_9HYPH|nr:ABC transporter permease subunit [Alsobacter metallidurans]GGH14268.1 amino acid ABC transporter permease [Alsobacter metallidurans]
MNWCQYPGYVIGNDALTNYGCRIFGGLGTTMELVAISVVLGSGLGLAIALVRLYGGVVSSSVAAAYTTFFRGTPLLAQLFLVYYGAGQIRPLLQDVGLWVYFREAFFCAAFTFTLNTAAYQAEVYRGAIQSVHRGQWEAARALGMRARHIFWKVVAPQAGMVALRPLGNELVIMVKSSAVASLVTILDLMGSTRFAFARSFDLMVYVFAALLYLLIVEIIRRVWDVIEQRLTRHLHTA